MGSSFSRGRKYCPNHLETVNNPNSSVEHARFASGDSSKQSGHSADEYLEDVVCNESDIQENEMKVFDIGNEGGKVLLVKQKGKITALGTKCSHYGAPLVTGVLGDGRIRCPWHGACFNVNTGDIEDFPGLDSLPCYEVKILNKEVVVKANKEHLETNKRIRSASKRVPSDPRTFIVVGGGAAGANCVETLRYSGYTGKLILISAENYLPYDRIKLSKSLDFEVKKILLRSEEFYRERDIEVMLSTELVALHPKSKSVELKDGDTLHYDKIFLATGASPRRPYVSGSDFQNIFVLRTLDDAHEIRAKLTDQSSVVVLGTSFIGMEAAAYCVSKVKSVSVIGRDEVPFRKVFGPVVGKKIKKMFEDKGVTFYMKNNILSFDGKNGTLNSVFLENGTTLEADICIIGIGVIPNTGYLGKAGLTLDRSGCVEVNEFLETSYPDVFAGGDIAYAPVLGTKAAIGHWGLANYHGHIAALNMLGKKKVLNAVPFFWTVLFGKSFRYTGYTSTYDDVVLKGDIQDTSFAAFYCLGNDVMAVVTFNRDPVAARFAEILYQGEKLEKSRITAWI